MWSARGGLRTLRTEWRLRGLKARWVRCCVGLDVCCWAAVVRLVSWRRAVGSRGCLVKRAEAGAWLQRGQRGVEMVVVVVVEMSGRAGLGVGGEEGVVAVLVLALPWQQASEAGGRVELQL